MKNFLATGTKIWKDNGVTENIRLAKELQLNPGEVRYKLLLDQEEDGQPAWLLATERGNVKILWELWVLVKEKGNPEEIKYNFLLTPNEYGETALHVAADGNMAVLEKLQAFFFTKPNFTKTS